MVHQLQQLMRLETRRRRLSVCCYIFIWLEKADEEFQNVGVPFYFSDYNELISHKENGEISDNDISRLVDWRDNLS